LCTDFEHAYIKIYQKIFRTFDKGVIDQCMYHVGQLTVELKIVNRKLNLLNYIGKPSNNMILNTLMKIDNDISLCSKYAVDNSNVIQHKHVIWSYFKNSVFGVT